MNRRAASLLAEDPKLASRLIRAQAENTWQHGDTRVWRWIYQLPAELVDSDPLLCMLRAFHLDMSGGERKEVERALQCADRAIDTNPGGDSEGAAHALDRSRLQGRLAAIRCVIDSRWGDLRGITVHAEQALRCLPEEDLIWRGCVALALGNARGFEGDMRGAYQARLEALRACEAAGLSYIAVVASLSVAITARDRGQLRRTIEICRNQIRRAHEHGLSQSKLTAWSLSVLGEALLETNDVDGALAQAEAAAKLVHRIEDVTFVGWCFMCLMRIRLSNGDLAVAEELMQMMTRRARESTMPPWVASQLAVWQVRLWLARGNLDSACHWLAERGLNTDVLEGVDYFSLLEYMTAARILMAQGRFADSADLVTRLLEIARKGGRTTSVIELLVLQALSFQAAGDVTRALNSLERVLRIAEPEGFVRVFVDEGPPMGRLLYEAVCRRIRPEHVRRLLGAFPVGQA
jgi:LuxR family maltose regulon positive regulatory protein